MIMIKLIAYLITGLMFLSFTFASGLMMTINQGWGTVFVILSIIWGIVFSAVGQQSGKEKLNGVILTVGITLHWFGVSLTSSSPFPALIALALGSVALIYLLNGIWHEWKSSMKGGDEIYYE